MLYWSSPLYNTLSSSQDIKDERPEEDAKVIWPFLVTVCAFFFNIVTTETIFGAYIYNYARCSKLTNMDSEAASTALTTFAGCMMARDFHSNFFKKFYFEISNKQADSAEFSFLQRYLRHFMRILI